jgi:hypothetical protein
VITLAVAGALSRLEAQLPSGARAPDSLPAATLEDQFGRVTNLATLRRRPAIVLAASRTGFDGAARWAAALARIAQPAGVPVLLIGDFVGAPRLVRGFIRGRLPRDTIRAALLDFSGTLGRPVRGPAAPLSVAVYGRTGTLQWHSPLPLDATDSVTVERIVLALTQP